MRIAIVAPPWLPVPPPAYGGTENTLDTLARGLKRAGHDVLLCTTGDSTCPVERTWVFEKSIGVGSGTSVDEIRHVTHAYGQLDDVDVVHDHTLVGPLYSASFPRLPVVTTNHGPFNADLIGLYRAVADRVPVIAISRHQASTAQDVAVAAVIHHGIDVDDYPAGPGGGGYALFLGRMHPGKAPHVAARIAREAGFPLRIAAKIAFGASDVCSGSPTRASNVSKRRCSSRLKRPVRSARSPAALKPSATAAPCATE